MLLKWATPISEGEVVHFLLPDPVPVSQKYARLGRWIKINKIDDR